MGSHNEKPIKQAIEELINLYHLRPKFNISRLNVYWEEWMGKTISRHTRSIYIKEKKLFISLDNATLKYELQFAKDKIIQLVNEKIGEEMITEVVIR